MLIAEQPFLFNEADYYNILYGTLLVYDTDEIEEYIQLVKSQIEHLAVLKEAGFNLSIKKRLVRAALITSEIEDIADENDEQNIREAQLKSVEPFEISEETFDQLMEESDYQPSVYLNFENGIIGPKITIEIDSEIIGEILYV